MRRRILLSFSLFIIPTAVLITTLVAHSDSADPEEVARMKFGHQKVEGVIIDLKSGLYTVRTSTGATLTLVNAAAVRLGYSIPKIGDGVTLWVNEGNMVMDVRPKGYTDKASHFITGTLTSIDYGKSQITLSMLGGEKGFLLRPESRMFRDIAIGAQVTIEVNDMGEVIDIHKDRK